MVQGGLPRHVSQRAACAVCMNALLLTLVGGVRSQGPDCRYKYTKQPRPDPICNPYISGTLRVECTSQVPVTATDVSIGWLLSCNPLSDDANITIVEQVSNMTSYLEITSRLTIGNLSDDYAGKYGCTILDSRDEEFIPSDLLELKTRFTLEVENARDSPCASSVVSSRAQQKCAELTENDTIPMSLSCVDPAIQSTAFNDIMTTVIQTTITPTFTSSISPPFSSHSSSSLVLATISPILLSSFPSPSTIIFPQNNGIFSFDNAPIIIGVALAVIGIITALVGILIAIISVLTLRKMKPRKVVTSTTTKTKEIYKICNVEMHKVNGKNHIGMDENAAYGAVTGGTDENHVYDAVTDGMGKNRTYGAAAVGADENPADGHVCTGMSKNLAYRSVADVIDEIPSYDSPPSGSVGHENTGSDDYVDMLEIASLQSTEQEPVYEVI